MRKTKVPKVVTGAKRQKQKQCFGVEFEAGVEDTPPS